VDDNCSINPPLYKTQSFITIFVKACYILSWGTTFIRHLQYFIDVRSRCGYIPCRDREVDNNQCGRAVSIAPWVVCVCVCVCACVMKVKATTLGLIHSNQKMWLSVVFSILEVFIWDCSHEIFLTLAAPIRQTAQGEVWRENFFLCKCLVPTG
jgi:hypothetical protein